mgnify:CR=1 FL=1
MYELDKRTYKVHCPGGLNMVVDMPIDYRRSPQGWINIPCNGCDQMSGDPRCALCRKAINDGGLYPACANAANEEANLAFRQGKIKFLEIEELVRSAVEASQHYDNYSLDDVLSMYN